MSKSPDAFRTISEVAEWLGVQAHVLRFWESKFTQVKPIKRAGGRRYYRPSDMLLIGGIKRLLHDDGMTIKGVQKILREEGMGHVVKLSQPLDDQEPPAPAPAETPVEEPGGVVLDFAQPAEAVEATVEESPAEPDVAAAPAEDGEDTQTIEMVEEPAASEEAPEEEAEQEQMQVAEPESAEAAEAPVAEDMPPPAPKPRIIDMPPLTAEVDLPAAPSALTAAFRLQGLDKATAEEVAPLLAQLTALRDRMNSARNSGQAGG